MRTDKCLWQILLCAEASVVEEYFVCVFKNSEIARSMRHVYGTTQLS